MPKAKQQIEDAVKKMSSSSDWSLVEENVSERAICHRLANYIQDQFPDWDVDCEYNRNFAADGLVKELPWSGQEFYDDDDQKFLQGKDSRMRRVLPDIIVHKRGSQDNYIVIEVKKRTNLDINNEKFDKTKLKTFKENVSFKYKHAFFIILDRNYIECRVEEIQ